ncbi:MAG: SUMF1/EgtB/PvdO family nonheme iron enzyme [Magnetococcales bacterium]|nr:SUMF1/EgtB/PvdO family nonheme iron enzyme [Magnetococcales bacterium]
MAITWLHISDLHFKTGDSYDPDTVLNSLVDSVKWFHDRNEKPLRPDFVFVTGDLAYSGKAIEYEAVSEFFDALIDAAGIDKSRLFVVPGNHDVDLTKREWLIRTLPNAETANRYFAPNQSLIHISHGQRAFVDWYNGYFKGIRIFPDKSSCGPVDAVDIDGCKIAILPLNSALFCAGKDDHEKLWLGRRALEREIKKLKGINADLKVALMHHPLDWLHDEERVNIDAKLSKVVDVVLRGHLHENNVVNTSGISGTVLHLAAGAAYQESSYPKRALFATVEEGQITVIPIHYVDSHSEVWVHDTALFPRDPGNKRSFPLPNVKGKCKAAPTDGPSGDRPSWAKESGRDKYGEWLTFALDVVVQKMRWIPPGRFLMGSPEDEPGRFMEEGPQHEVIIEKGYWLFDTPCTQALWQVVMGNNPSYFQSSSRPVENVSWNDVQEFLEKINQRISGLNLILPSEAQWEYACRAGTTTALYTGAIEILGERNAPTLDPIAWYGGNSGVGFDLDNGIDSKEWSEKQYPHEKAGTHPVGLKIANPWGLYDMLGNVCEWCDDHWHESYEGAPTDGTAWLGVGRKAGGVRVFRGGSWIGSARIVRAAYRSWDFPVFRSDYLGFRCARVSS